MANPLNSFKKSRFSGNLAAFSHVETTMFLMKITIFNRQIMINPR